MRKNTPMSKFFFFMLEFTKLSRKLPEEVAIAEQLVKVFINSFCNAIMLLSLKHQQKQKTSGKI